MARELMFICHGRTTHSQTNAVRVCPPDELTPNKLTRGPSGVLDLLALSSHILIEIPPAMVMERRPRVAEKGTLRIRRRAV